MHAPFLVVSDIHFHKWSQFSRTLENGSNSRLMDIIDQLEVMVRAVHAGGNNRVYIAGDLFHVRGSIPPSVLNPVLDFFGNWENEDIEFRIIPGNHDLETRGTTTIGDAIGALIAFGNVTLVEETTFFDDDQVAMIPWFDKLDDLRAEIGKARQALRDQGLDSKNYSLIIHAPMNGVIKGIPDVGLDPGEGCLQDWRHVFCGHYHNHVDFGSGVYSIGALTHQTWSDVGSKAGALFVAANNEVTHLASNAPKFIDFDETWNDIDAAMNCDGNYVRVELDEATEGEIFMIRDQIERDFGAAGVLIKSMPKVAVTTRAEAIKSAATLEASIDEWLTLNPTTDVEKDDVYQECSDILSEVL